MGNTILNAGFLQFDNQFTPDLRVVWGVRVEDFDQLIGSTKVSDDRHGYSRVRDWLPGVNITYRLNAKTNIRLSGSQTVVRPEFREIGPFGFYDFELNASVEGYSSLKRTKVTNIDARYELYPRSGETFSIGAFFKNFEMPIEQLFFPGAGGSSLFNYRNVDNARAYGAELELRKRLDFISGLQHFTFQSNLAYIYSRVKNASTANVSVDRPLQGQSPYVINTSLMYDHEKTGLNATLLFNQIGRRIAYVGNIKQGVPDIWEAPRPLVDFQVSKKLLNNKGEVRLNISDLLNKRLFFYQNTEVDAKSQEFNMNTDAVRFSRRFGTNVSISFGYNF
jgi:outer membrane receptor protein involved in Fe transport